MTHDERRPLRLEPFRATRFAGDVDHHQVICPPYDVIDEPALEAYRAADPHNIVHVTVPPDSQDVDRYQHAARELRRWYHDGALRTDDEPALYVYRHRDGDHVSIGLVGGVGLDGPVLPHERTFPQPVADRAALMRATSAQLEPILLTYEGGSAVSSIVDDVSAGPPDIDVDGADGRSHRIWRIADPADLDVIAADLAERSALIADGHHRFAAYRALHETTPSAATAYGLAMLVDAGRCPLELRGVDRSVAGLSLDEAVRLARPAFDAVPLDARENPDDALTVPETAFVLADRDHRVLLRVNDPTLVDGMFDAGRSPVWKRLDAAVLTDVLLSRLWNVDDADQRVGYHHAHSDALQAARRTDGTAVLVRPPTLADVGNVAASGVSMPRKSTSFGPKPWTGLLMRLLDDPLS